MSLWNNIARLPWVMIPIIPTHETTELRHFWLIINEKSTRNLEKSSCPASGPKFCETAPRPWVLVWGRSAWFLDDLSGFKVPKASISPTMTLQTQALAWETLVWSNLPHTGRISTTAWLVENANRSYLQPDAKNPGLLASVSSCIPSYPYMNEAKWSRQFVS